MSNVSVLIDGLDLTSADGVDSALLRTNGDENSLYELVSFLRSQSLATRKLVENAFGFICYFYTDSEHEKLRKLASKAVAKLEGTAAFNKIMEDTKGELGGVELAEASGKQFVIFLPDASEPGRFRYSCFDKRGFFNHATFDTYEEALKDAWRCGFRIRVFDALNDLSVTQDWHEGSKFTALVQQHNLGKVSYDDVIRSMESLSGSAKNLAVQGEDE